MSCAIVTGTSATDMLSTTKQTTAIITTPSHCAKDRVAPNSKPVALATPLPSAWSDRPCNSAKDLRDGTLGCWGQWFRADTSGILYWSTW